jgi:DNA-binding SARP family transcriptional activator
VLNQLVYAQRKQLDNQHLFLGQKTLRLNREVIWTDVGAFESALEAGAIEEAVQYYAGPFLDGFFVRDAPEFERWVDRERSRLARRCSDALVKLAEQASAAGRQSEAVAWRTRVLELDPLDTSRTVALVRAHMAAGNHPEALRVARRHEVDLREEVGVAPSAELRVLLQELLGGSASSPPI